MYTSARTDALTHTSIVRRKLPTISVMPTSMLTAMARDATANDDVRIRTANDLRL